MAEFSIALQQDEITEILRLGRCPDCVHLFIFEDSESGWCLYPECRCGRAEE